MSDDTSPWPRRKFLGAAAVLATLSQTAEAERTDPDELVEDQETVTDDGYTVTDCGSVPGKLAYVHADTHNVDGPVSVEGVYEPDPNGWSGVDLKLQTELVDVGTGLKPDDARDLAERLEVAADAAEGKLDE